MDVDTALEFARSRRRCVLVTIRRNGRPQLSNVLHQVTDDGALRVSITTDRAKYKNLVRDPWAAVHLTSDDFWTWVVLECAVELTEPASAPDDTTVAQLVDYYRSANGEHPDWDEYRAAMVAERRVLATLRPDHAYGQLPG